MQEKHQFSFTDYGDCIDDNAIIKIYINKSKCNTNTGLSITIPPSIKVSINDHIYQPFNDERYGIYELGNDCKGKYYMQSSKASHINSKRSKITHHLLPNGITPSTLAGSHIYDRNYPAPSLAPYNYNIFQQLFGIIYSNANKDVVRQISLFEYVSCFNLNKNIAHTISSSLNNISVLDQALTGNVSEELIKAIYYKLHSIRSSNTDIFIPDSCAPVATISTFLNGVVTIQLPKRDA